LTTSDLVIAFAEKLTWAVVLLVVFSCLDYEPPRHG
jgi:hypothetical protein